MDEELKVERTSSTNKRRYSDGDFQFDDVPEHLNTEDKQVVKQFNHDVIRSENTVVHPGTSRGQIHLKQTAKANEGSLLRLFQC